MLDGFREKYLLSDNAYAGMRRGIFWTTATNLVTMGGIGFLFYAMDGFVAHLTDGAELPSLPAVALGLVAAFAVALFLCNWQQYNNTYCVFYRESGQQRIGIAERLRKLPLSFFGRRDLAIQQHVLRLHRDHHGRRPDRLSTPSAAHVLGELWGAVISTLHHRLFSSAGFVALARPLLAAGPGRVLEHPGDLGLTRDHCRALFASRAAWRILRLPCSLSRGANGANRAQKVRVTEAIQETLDCVREIRATNQEGRYLEGLFGQVDRCERVCAKGELTNGLVVNGAYAVLRLGIATTVAAGASLVAAGQVGPHDALRLPAHGHAHLRALRPGARPSLRALCRADECRPHALHPRGAAGHGLRGLPPGWP